MRRDSPLAQKESVTPEDLLDKPLILSQQEARGGSLDVYKRQVSHGLDGTALAGDPVVLADNAEGVGAVGEIGRQLV